MSLPQDSIAAADHGTSAAIAKALQKIEQSIERRGEVENLQPVSRRLQIARLRLEEARLIVEEVQS